MKQYELETGTLGFVEVKPTWSSFRIESHSLYFKCRTTEGKFAKGSTETLIGDWQSLSLFSQLKEEDVKEVMPLIKRVYGQSYYDYMVKFKVGFGYVGTALEAIHSLAQHLGLDTTQPIFVIFKPKQECKCTDEQSWNCMECIKPR